MDATLKNFLQMKKNLILDTKLPAIRKQQTVVPKTPKGMMDKPLDADPYRRFATSAIKEKPSKKDIVEKIQSFIDAAEAML
jgi:hypothetical protein